MMTKELDKKTNKTLSFRRVEEKPRGSENPEDEDRGLKNRR